MHTPHEYEYQRVFEFVDVAWGLRNEYPSVDEYPISKHAANICRWNQYPPKHTELILFSWNKKSLSIMGRILVRGTGTISETEQILVRGTKTVSKRCGEY